MQACCVLVMSRVLELHALVTTTPRETITVSQIQPRGRGCIRPVWYTMLVNMWWNKILTNVKMSIQIGRCVARSGSVARSVARSTQSSELITLLWGGFDSTCSLCNTVAPYYTTISQLIKETSLNRNKEVVIEAEAKIHYKRLYTGALI